MKPTEAQVIAWARKAGVINCDCCLPFWPEEDQVNWEIFFERLATIAHEAGRKDENDQCAQIIEEEKQKYSERANRPDDTRDINPEVARIAMMTCDFIAASLRGKK